MLKIQHISFGVEDKDAKKEILNDINIEFEEGKTYVITGPNGGGKSTLVKTIMGIIKPDKGKIFFESKDITDYPIDERARMGLSFAFQKPVTFKGLKVKDLLDIASGKKNNIGQSCDYLSMVGLCAKDYIDRPVDDNLSGGEQKRIELAMVLAKGGKVNIFDEPEAGIDLWSFEKLTKIFASLKDSINIIVSHQRKILEIADKVILIKNGKLEMVDTYQNVQPFLEENTCKILKN